MLRAAVLTFAWLFLAGAVVAVIELPEAWPMLVMAALLLLGTVYERYHYRGTSRPERTPGRWQQTSERFRDEESGRLVTVWYNSATGERRYVEEGETPSTD